MKKILKVMCVLGLILFVFWGWNVLKCEYLTLRYAHEFDFTVAAEENTMISKPERVKILSCNSDSARVYYVEKDFAAGHILAFKKEQGKWKYDRWEKTAWSSLGGSADDDVWPYFWHSFIYR